jgi:Flp pilus assembly protein TadG
MSSSEFVRATRSFAQRGHVAVEFSIVMFMFVSVLLGIIDFSRWLFAINSANEAAREGARVAVVCDLSDSAIQQHMAPWLITATGGSISVSYTPGGCVANASGGTPCAGVTVSLSGYTVPRVAWFLPTMTLPTATTFLPRESMDSTNNDRCV